MALLQSAMSCDNLELTSSILGVSLVNFIHAINLCPDINKRRVYIDKYFRQLELAHTMFKEHDSQMYKEMSEQLKRREEMEKLNRRKDAVLAAINTTKQPAFTTFTGARGRENEKRGGEEKRTGKSVESTEINLWL